MSNPYPHPSALLPTLALLWFFILRDLSLHWSANPHYQHAWAVPFLSAYLAWKAWKPAHITLASSIPDPIGSGYKHVAAQSSTLATTSVTLLAALWLPVRLVGEANPDWRIVMWAMAIIAIGITLLLSGIASPRRGAQPGQMIFALCFFLVAVPWPGIIENPIISALTRQNTAATVELLGILGIPAMAQGSAIQLVTGVVGIDEACSGIRSLQANLMLALYFGQHFHRRPCERLLLVGLGLLLTIVFNLLRTVLLSYVAAEHGIAAVNNWHDLTGTTILILGFASLYGAARLFPKKPTHPPVSHNPFAWRHLNGTSHLSSLALLFWLLLTEMAVQGWYKWHEKDLAPPVTWRIVLPADLPGARQVPFAEREKLLLRFDDAVNIEWNDAHLRWQAVFLEWKPGRISAMAARGHTPEGCLPGSGRRLVHSEAERMLDLPG